MEEVLRMFNNFGNCLFFGKYLLARNVELEKVLLISLNDLSRFFCTTCTPTC